MVRPILQSGLVGLNAASDSFDRSQRRLPVWLEHPPPPTPMRPLEFRRRRAEQVPCKTAIRPATLEATIAPSTRSSRFSGSYKTGDGMSDELTKLGQKS